MVGTLGVVLADQQTLFLDALTSALTRERHRVLAAATTRQALLDAVRDRAPDLCLIDSEFPDGDGLSVIAEVAALRPVARVVVLSGDPRPATMERALNAGACGFVHKSRGLAAVLKAVHEVGGGGLVAAGFRLPQVASSGTPGHLAGYLTPRELDCLQMISDGLDTAAMARRLGVSPATIRSHVQAVLTKLGAHSRLEAASLAIRHGLVDAAARGA